MKKIKPESQYRGEAVRNVLNFKLKLKQSQEKLKKGFDDLILHLAG